MKRIFLAGVLVAMLLTSSACSVDNGSSDSVNEKNNSEYEKMDSLTPGAVTGIEYGDEVDYFTHEVGKSNSEYKADRPDAFSMFDDYETVIAICSDACEEFVNAVKSGSADFSPYINNVALNAYMEYRVKNHIFGYSDPTKTRYLVTSVEFEKDYAVVKGVLAISSGGSNGLEGEVYFLVTNEQGNIVISDWYWNHKDSSDVTYRGEFATEKHPGYWNDPVKYADLMETLKIELGE